MSSTVVFLRSPIQSTGDSATSPSSTVSIGQSVPNPNRDESPITVEAKISKQRLSEDISQLNDMIQNIRRELHFSVDDGTGQTIIKVLDSDTQEVIREIPAEEVVALMEHLQQHGSSLLVDVKA